jgi:SNF2 family DNA or RNA helicase
VPATIFGELTADHTSIILMASGPDFEVAEASRRLQTLTPLVKPTEPAGALTLPASWPAVVQLSATFGAHWAPGPNLTVWLAEQVRARTQPATALTVAPPVGMVPRSYQIKAACMIGAVGRVLLFDEPRTGKTISTILGLVERHAAGHPVLPAVVVCPASVIDAWVKHVNAWTPGWRAVAWRGTPQRRTRLIGTADVYVTSFETSRRDADQRPKAPLRVLNPQGIVIDECHKVKDPAAAQTRAVLRLTKRAQTYVALSGTPITHHPGNLHPTLQGLSPVAWPSGERWVARYCASIAGDYRSTVLGLNPEAEPEFRMTMLGQHRRVARADVLAELPKLYTTQIVDLPTEWRQAYDSVESDMLAELPDGGELSVMGVLAQINLLSLLASAPADMEIETVIVADPLTGLPIEKQKRHAILKDPSWKVDELLKVLKERPGYAVVAFAPSKQLMMLAGQAAEKAGHRVGYVIGGQRAKDRTDTVDAFQARELDLLCATTGAGGTGLTLSAADALVFLQRPWSLVESVQSEDRAEGDAAKQRGTEIVDIIARNTIETRIRAVLRERAGQLADLVQDPRIVRELLGGSEVRDLKRKAVAA